jgi:hypothetical protein
MAPENETGVLAVLLALAAALYAVAWLVAGPAAYPEAPATGLLAGHAPSAELATRLASSVPAPR